MKIRHGKDAGQMIKAGIIGETGYAGGELVYWRGIRMLRLYGMVPEVILIRGMPMYTGICFRS